MSSITNYVTGLKGNESFGPSGEAISQADFNKVIEFLSKKSPAAALRDANTLMQTHPMVAQSLGRGYSYFLGLVKTNSDSMQVGVGKLKTLDVKSLMDSWKTAKPDSPPDKLVRLSHIQSASDVTEPAPGVRAAMRAGEFANPIMFDVLIAEDGNAYYKMGDAEAWSPMDDAARASLKRRFEHNVNCWGGGIRQVGGGRTYESSILSALGSLEKAPIGGEGEAKQLEFRPLKLEPLFDVTPDSSNGQLIRLSTIGRAGEKETKEPGMPGVGVHLDMTAGRASDQVSFSVFVANDGQAYIRRGDAKDWSALNDTDAAGLKERLSWQTKSFGLGVRQAGQVFTSYESAVLSAIGHLDK